MTESTSPEPNERRALCVEPTGEPQFDTTFCRGVIFAVSGPESLTDTGNDVTALLVSSLTTARSPQPASPPGR